MFSAVCSRDVNEALRVPPCCVQTVKIMQQHFLSILHYEAEKEPIFFCVHLLTETGYFFTHIRPKKCIYKVQFRVFNFSMRWEFCSDADTKHFMFTSQVMKLMITGLFRFHYYAKLLTHAKLNTHGIVAYTFFNICEKIHQFLSSIKRHAQ